MADYGEDTNGAKAYVLAIRFLGLRPRSRYEILAYLRRKNIEDEIITEVTGRLESIGLINDIEFAGSWIASRQAVRPRSRRVLEQELIAKGVSRDDIAVALSDMHEDDELESLVGVMERKRRLSQYQQPAKLQEYLLRQGYSYTHIKKALARLDEDAS